MFRFTIRDVLWLMVMVSILLLWATERKWRSIDWTKAMKNEGRLYNLVDEYREKMRKVNAQSIAEHKLRLEAEKRLAEAEAANEK